MPGQLETGLRGREVKQLVAELQMRELRAQHQQRMQASQQGQPSAGSRPQAMTVDEYREREAQRR